MHEGFIMCSSFVFWLKEEEGGIYIWDTCRPRDFRERRGRQKRGEGIQLFQNLAKKAKAFRIWAPLNSLWA